MKTDPITITHVALRGRGHASLLCIRTRVRRAWVAIAVLFGVLWLVALPRGGAPARAPFMLVVTGIIGTATIAVLAVAEIRLRRRSSGVILIDSPNRRIRRESGFHGLSWDDLDVPADAAIVVERFQQRSAIPRGNPLSRIRLVIDPAPAREDDAWSEWADHLERRVWIRPPRPPPGSHLVLSSLPEAATSQAVTHLSELLGLEVVDLSELQENRGAAARRVGASAAAPLGASR